MKSSTLPILLLLLTTIYSQTCYPIGGQTTSANSLTGQLSALIKSSSQSQTKSTNSGLQLACNTIGSPTVQTALRTSNPISTTIQITQNQPTNTNPYVGGPAYYQATGSFPWGGLTSMTFETTGYVPPAQQAQSSTVAQTQVISQSQSQQTQQIQQSPQIPQITVQPIIPQIAITQSQQVNDIRNINTVSTVNTVNTVPVVPVQPNIVQIQPNIIPIQSNPIPIQVDQTYNTITQSLPQVSQTNIVTSTIPVYPTSTIPPSNVVPINFYPSQQTNTQAITTNYQGGSNLIPIVGDVPVPVSNNYFGQMVPVNTIPDYNVNQFINPNNIISTSIPITQSFPTQTIPISHTIIPSSQIINTQPLISTYIPSNNVVVSNTTTIQTSSAQPTQTNLIPVSISTPLIPSATGASTTSTRSTTTTSTNNNAVVSQPIQTVGNNNTTGSSSSSYYFSATNTLSPASTPVSPSVQTVSLPNVAATPSIIPYTSIDSSNFTPTPLDIKNFNLADFNLDDLFKDFGTPSGNSSTVTTTTTTSSQRSSTSS